MTFVVETVNIRKTASCRSKMEEAKVFSLRDRSRSRKHPRKGASKILVQVDTLIDDLLNDAELSSSSLASILMAARDSVRDGYHVALARRIWDANNDLKLRDCQRAAEVLDPLPVE